MKRIKSEEVRWRKTRCVTSSLFELAWRNSTIISAGMAGFLRKITAAHEEKNLRDMEKLNYLLG